MIEKETGTYTLAVPMDEQKRSRVVYTKIGMVILYCKEGFSEGILS